MTLEEKLRSAWREPFSTEHDPRYLLLLAAEEIARLLRLINKSQKPPAQRFLFDNE
jgi:hypothetical protein